MNANRHESERRGSALDELLLRAERRIRVLDGPLTGASYKIWSGIRIGRKPTADVLVLLPDVSREHAQLVEDMHGDHWLMDLESSNGTWIGTQRVGRQLLIPGTVFRIGDVRFIYEDEPIVPVADATNEVMAVSYHHAPGRRSTRELRYDGGTALQMVRGSAADEPQDASRMQRVEAVGPGGERYEGCLVDDLVEYRSLRLRMSRHGLGNTGLLDRVERLSERLWGPREASTWESGRRRPLSFSCRLPAALRLADGSSRIATVRSLGVAGAELEAPRMALAEGDVVWLAVELVIASRPHSVVSTCRVSSRVGDRVQLSFVGLSDEREIVPQSLDTTLASSRSRLAAVHVSSTVASGTHG